MKAMKAMKTVLISVILFTSLLMTGCADDVWCGDNGCGADKDANINRTT
jgi:hypothetical protein